MFKSPKIIFLAVLQFSNISLRILAQAPPPPPGGPGTTDPPIGGTLPIDDGFIFLLIPALIYIAFKTHQSYTLKKSI